MSNHDNIADGAKPSATGWAAPSAVDRGRLLDRTKSIAIVGASSKPSRASSFVLTYLRSSLCHFTVYPVNPRETEIQGLTCYPSLDALPEVPDMVDVFRRASDCPAVAQEAVDIGAKSLWLQLGVWSDEAAEIAHSAGLDVVMDRCTKIEHARFAGGLHLAGFNTGVIDSSRSR